MSPARTIGKKMAAILLPNSLVPSTYAMHSFTRVLAIAAIVMEVTATFGSKVDLGQCGQCQGYGIDIRQAGDYAGGINSCIAEIDAGEL